MKRLASQWADHPMVEAHIAGNADILDRLACAQFDLAVAWDDGTSSPRTYPIALLPIRWIGPIATDDDRAHGFWTARTAVGLPQTIEPLVDAHLGLPALPDFGIAPKSVSSVINRARSRTPWWLNR